MASIISAGTTSGTSLNLSGDTSGELQLQTNGSTTAVTISTGQLVGIGTTSPDGLITLPATASNTPKIRLQSATSDVDVTISSYADSSGTYAAFGSNFYLNSSGDEAVFDSAKRSSFIRVDGRNTGAITFGTATTGVTAERMRITSTGQVGIGTSTPGTTLNVFTGSTLEGLRIQRFPGAYYSELRQTDGPESLAFLVGDGTTVAERMRISGTGAVVLQGGTTTANGVGITFPATQSASSNANTLDDYEEGTWTPTLRFGGNSVGMTYSTQAGSYTKIGRFVYATFRITLSNKGSSTGSASIGGLPFTSGAGITNYSAGTYGYFDTVSNGARWSVQQLPTQDAGTSTIQLRYYTGSATVDHNDASFSNSTDIIMYVVYQV